MFNIKEIRMDWLTELKSHGCNIMELNWNSEENWINIDDFETVFKIACENNMLDFVKWIYSFEKRDCNKNYYGYHRDYVYKFDTNIFHNCCKNGHFEVAKWLWSTFDCKN